MKTSPAVMWLWASLQFFRKPRPSLFGEQQRRDLLEARRSMLRKISSEVKKRALTVSVSGIQSGAARERLNHYYETETVTS